MAFSAILEALLCTYFSNEKYLDCRHWIGESHLMYRPYKEGSFGVGQLDESILPGGVWDWDGKDGLHNF